MLGLEDGKLVLGLEDSKLLLGLEDGELELGLEDGELVLDLEDSELEQVLDDGALLLGIALGQQQQQCANKLYHQIGFITICNITEEFT